MLYVISGTDTTAVRKKAASLRQALHKKRPAAEFLKLDDPTDVSAGRLEELVRSQGLFDRKYIIQLDRLFDTKEARDAVLAHRKELQESENVFLLIESQIDPKTLTKLKECAEHVDEFSQALPKEKEINMFALADALGSRDRKKLWILYQQARRAQKEPEEIHGILFWQLKAILLAGTARSAQEAGLKQFPYQKAKKFSQNFKENEPHALMGSLVELYHDARRGGDMSTKLEQFILSV